MIYRVIMDGNDILNFQERPYVLISPVLNTELNAAGSFEFTMPPSHAFYDAVRPLASSVAVYEDGTLLWFGRPVETKVDFFNQKTVYCEGALAFFSDSIQRPREYDSISLHAFLESVVASHNAQVAANRQFEIGSVTVPDRTVYRKLNYESTFDVLKRMCVEAEGGYLFTRREGGVNYLDWLEGMPYACNQPVEFGLNLLDISSGFDGSSIATCVIPLGDTDRDTGEPLTVAELNGGSDVIESAAAATFGRITKVVTFSGTRDAAELYEQGREYLRNVQFDGLAIECSAAELHAINGNYEPFRVGQTIRCHSEPHLMDREFPLVKLSLRLDTAAKRISLGTAERQSLSRIYKDMADTVEAVEDMDSETVESLMEALESAGDLATMDDLEQALDGLATLDELGGMLDDYAKLDDISELLEPLATKDELSEAKEELATKEEIEEVREDIRELRESVGAGGGHGGWVHQIDGETVEGGTINFVTAS